MSDKEVVVAFVAAGRKTTIRPEIISIMDVLTAQNLRIPLYQRPYKWTLRNVNQLIDDILYFRKQSEYRLGTVVYHSENGELNIVDGQQRTITLLLIALAITRNEALMEKVCKARVQVPQLKNISSLQFGNVISKNNIRDNFQEVQRRIVEFDEDTVSFFFERCQVVKVVLNDISEAFQFFDSQNARGVDLEPHDLLKAFHLREMMDSTSEIERIKIVDSWENLDSNDLKHTFASYLHRIRNWSKGKSARTFTKKDVGNFKGISPGVSEPYPFAAIYRISHFYVDGYNAAFERKIDRNKMPFPFQLDQIIINGKRFFEMIAHYSKVMQRKDLPELKGFAAKILKTIDTYDARHRTGDQYVRNLFDCALVYYIDKFGASELERAIEKIFIWAYSVRLTYHSVQLASIDNYAIETPLFRSIKNALKPSDFLNLKIKTLSVNDLQESDKTVALKKLFIKMNYIYE